LPRTWSDTIRTKPGIAPTTSGPQIAWPRRS